MGRTRGGLAHADPSVIATALLFGCRFPEGADSEPPQANVLVLLLDDLGTDKIAAYGDHPSPPPTPTLDALAADGVLFRNTWASCICSPSRGMLLTGRYGRRFGLGLNVDAEDPPGSSRTRRC